MNEPSLSAQSYWRSLPVTDWPTPKAWSQPHGSADVAVKVAGASPETVAVAVTGPMGPSERMAAVTPLAFVVLVSGDTVAPPAATAQLTVAPASAAPFEPITTTRSESGRSSPPGPVCAFPLTTAIDFAVIGAVELPPQLQSRTEPPTTTARRANQDARMEQLLWCGTHLHLPGKVPAISSSHRSSRSRRAAGR